MPLDLSGTLVVGISATALFDLTEADGVFKAKYAQDKETAVAEYRAYMLKHEDEALQDGTGMPLVRALLQLNRYQKKRVGVEFKRADTPKVTPSMRIAMHDLKLDALYVVYPGAHRVSLADGVEAVPLWALMPGGYSQAVSE